MYLQPKWTTPNWTPAEDSISVLPVDIIWRKVAKEIKKKLLALLCHLKRGEYPSLHHYQIFSHLGAEGWVENGCVWNHAMPSELWSGSLFQPNQSVRAMVFDDAAWNQRIFERKPWASPLQIPASSEKFGWDKEQLNHAPV
jgi:hypothetical protein